MEIKLDTKYESDIYGPIRRVLSVDRNNQVYPVVVEFQDGSVEFYTSQGVGCLKDQLIEVCEFKKGDPVMVSANIGETK